MIATTEFSPSLRLKDAPIDTNPWAHIAVKDYFSSTEESRQKLFAELRALTTKLNEVNKNREEGEYRNQYEVSLDDLKKFDMPMCHQVLSHLASQDLSLEISDRLKGFIENSTGYTPEEVAKFVATPACRRSYISMCPSQKQSKRRELHTDGNSVIHVLNYYVRLPEDYSSGGALCLMQEDRRLRDLTFKQALGTYFMNSYPTDIWVAKSYEYKDNLLAVQPGGPFNWHEVSTRFGEKNPPRIAFHSTLTVPKDYVKKWTRTNLLKSKFTDLKMAFSNKSGGPRG